MNTVHISYTARPITGEWPPLGAAVKRHIVVPADVPMSRVFDALHTRHPAHQVTGLMILSTAPEWGTPVMTLAEVAP
jgi:hypothetical protein